MSPDVDSKRRYFKLDMHFDVNPLKSSISCRSESSNCSLVVNIFSESTHIEALIKACKIMEIKKKSYLYNPSGQWTHRIAGTLQLWSVIAWHVVFNYLSRYLHLSRFADPPDRYTHYTIRSL